MRTFGTLAFEKSKKKGAQWVATAEPHVMLRLKRTFPRMHQALSALRLTDTLEVCRDLLWFTERFPLEVSSADLKRLKRRAKEHAEHENLVEEIAMGKREYGAFDLAIPARDYQVQAAELAMQTRGLLLADDMGIGKQHPIDTQVQTPMGYTPIGQLKIGDQVIGSGGKPVKVTGVFPQGIKPAYRVTFTDGSSVEAGPEHLWTMRYFRGGRKLADIVLTTDQIRLGAKVQTRWPGRGVSTLNLSKTHLYLPLLKGPIEFKPAGKLSIPPYTLGVLIANGATQTQTSVTTHTQDWPEIKRHLSREGVSIGATNVYGNATRTGVLGLRDALRELQLDTLSIKKRIPNQYLRAAPQERLALLQGLLDSDGSISRTRNRVVYCTRSRGLAHDVVELVQCLGGLASIREYDRSSERKGTEFHVRIRLPPGVKPFRLKRKAQRYKIKLRHYPTRSVRSIEYVRDVESVCIAVAAADSLYCVENAILTHNTVSAICLLSRPEARPALVLTLTALPWQWEAEIKRFAPGLTTHILKKGTPYEIRQLVRGPKGEMQGFWPDVIITNYHKLDGWRDALAGKFVTVVADEVQMLRNPKTGISQAWAHIAHGARYRMGLSGTPIHNLGSEMYPVIEALAPGRLGERSEFLQEWCTAPDRRDRASLVDPAAFGTYLRAQGLMLRRTRKDVGRELPGLTKIVHHVDHEAAELKKIEGKAAELARIILSGSAKRGEAFEASGEFSYLLRQATGLSKAVAVADFVKLAIENDERVVLYGWHHSVYDLWEKRLEEYQPAWFTGEETGKAKRHSQERFMNGETPLLIMSLRAGAGVDGLQQKCRTVIFGELDWSPAVHEQCITRVFRDGQTDKVAAYFLLSEEGSDPVIADVLGIKRAQLEGVRDPSGAFLENLEVEGDHVRKLAAAYLRKVAA